MHPGTASKTPYQPQLQPAMTDSHQCHVPHCSSPAAGTGIHASHPLCQRHLEQDKQSVRTQLCSVRDRLQPLMTFSNRLQADRQALEAELASAQMILSAAIQSLEKHKQAIADRLSEKIREANNALDNLSALQELDKRLTAAETEVDIDLRRLYDEANGMSLQLNDLEEQMAHGRLNMGDVCGGLRCFQLSVDSQLKNLMQLCDSTNPVREDASVFTLHSKIYNLPGIPSFITTGSNTKGFSADASGRVTRMTGSAVDDEPNIPEPCIFIAFHPSPRLEYLAACSTDGSVRLRIQADLDWCEPIQGLSCDSRRQALYVAHSACVIVIDLSGRLFRKNNWSNFCICGMACSSEKIIALSRRPDSQLQLLCIDKDNLELEATVSISDIHLEEPKARFMTALDHAVLITDAGRIYKICTKSGRLISTISHLHEPAGIAAHRSGLLVFFSERCQHVVRAVCGDGTFLQTLGVAGQAGCVEDRPSKLNNPWCLAFVEGEADLLAVSQFDAKSISLFRVHVGA